MSEGKTIYMDRSYFISFSKFETYHKNKYHCKTNLINREKIFVRSLGN
jgi:hypothetical protein